MRQCLVAEVLASAPMVTGGVDYDTMPFFESSAGSTTGRPPLVDPAAADARAALNRSVARSAVVPGYVDPVIDSNTGLVVEGGNRLPTGPKVIQAIPGGDPGSASITVRPGSETPTYESGDGQVDLITPFLPGMEDILNVPPRPQVDPRTGRIPGTSGTFNL